MKKLISLVLILGSIFITSCEDPYDPYQSALDLDKSIRLQDSLKLEQAKKCVDVTNYHLSDKNSVGGVDVYITFKNISTKPIKYVVFTVEPVKLETLYIDPYRTVDDINKYHRRLKIDFEVKPNDACQNIVWEEVWDKNFYGSGFNFIKIIKIEIYFYNNGKI